MGVPLKANSPLFTFAIKSATATSDDAFLGKQLQPKIHFRFRALIAEGRNNPRCAYWTFENNRRASSSASSASSSTDAAHSASPHHRGKWSTKGCEVKAVYPAQRLFAAYEYINCSCDRVAPIAVLMDVTLSPVAFEESLALSVVSYLGLISSIAVLLLTFFILSIIRGLRTNSNDIHKNIVICLLAVQLLFLIALKFRDPLIQREVRAKGCVSSFKTLFSDTVIYAPLLRAQAFKSTLSINRGSLASIFCAA